MCFRLLHQRKRRDMMQFIYGLVTRSSWRERTRSPHRRAGLTKLHNRLSPLCMRQPSLSPFTYVGFRFSAVKLVSQGEACCRFGTVACLVHRLFCGYLLELSALCTGSRTYTARRVSGPAGSTPAALTNQFFTPQSGLANGPEWAALKKHRQRYTPAIAFPDLAEVLDELTAVTVELTQTGSESARYAHLVPFVSKQQ